MHQSFLAAPPGFPAYNDGGALGCSAREALVCAWREGTNRAAGRRWSTAVRAERSQALSSSRAQRRLPGKAYQSGFATLARPAGGAGIGFESIDFAQPADPADALRAGIADGGPCLTDAIINTEENPAGAGALERLGLATCRPAIGGNKPT